MNQTSPKRKKNFAWYKNGRKKGIIDIVDSLVSNPHYDLEKTTEICLNYTHCNDVSLMSEEDRKQLRIDILHQLGDRIKREKQEIKKNILETMEQLKSSIESEIQYANENPDYMPSVDRYDMRNMHDVDNMEYEVSKLEQLYNRLEKEISIK